MFSIVIHVILIADNRHMLGVTSSGISNTLNEMEQATQRAMRMLLGTYFLSWRFFESFLLYRKEDGFLGWLG